ncbi:Aste57867_11823 [Aphanomyces stellatus]|uniref:Aste57867_11823 protein n=1 Tax=Aphanomyces stellatus TaxID=120398 RepID=A0A485KVZ1_9STRA|nr:hypothetical protein As57867_011778 [Aphanomyces stellatus]VFT88678.1 Aste57867_11823 [Aphanomyces stellatus]
MATSDALFLPSANWYCSQLGAWGEPLDGSNEYYFAFGCKARVALYKVEKMSENALSQPTFVADVGRGKHDKKVTSVTFIHSAQNELLLVCAGEEGSVQIWNVATLELLEQHRKHKTEVMAISCKDNNTIVAGDRNGTISVWQRNTGSIALHVPIAGDCIYCLAVCPQRPQDVAIGFRSGKLILVDHTTGDILTRFKGHDEEIHAVRWRPNSDVPTLGSSSRDKKIRVWQGDALLHEWSLPRPKKNISTHQLGRLWLTFTWIPSSNYGIVCSSITGDMLRFEWTPKQKKASTPTLFKQNHTRLVFNIAPLVCSRTSVWLLSISMDREVRLTSLQSMACHAKLVGLGGHVYALRHDPLTRALAAGIGDQSIRVIDVVTGGSEMLWKGLQSKITALCWHPLVPSLLAYGTEEGHVGVYNTKSQEHTRFKTFHGAMVRQVAWFVASLGKDNDTATNWMKNLEEIEAGHVDVDDTTSSVVPATVCELWSCDVNGGLMASNPDLPDALSVNLNKRMDMTHATCFGWTLLSSHNHILAVGTPEGTVQVYESSSGRERIMWKAAHTYFDHAKPVTAIAWTGTTLATASNDATVCVYHMEASGKYLPMRHCLTGHAGGITSLEWSPSGDYLASASIDATVQVWHVGQVPSRGFNFRGHVGRVLAVTWLDDATLASGGEGQSIRRWQFAKQPFSTPPKPKTVDESPAATPKKKEKAAQTMFHHAPDTDVTPLAAFLSTEQAQFEADGDFDAAARLLILQGRIGDALRLVSRHGKLSPTWLAYAPLAGMDVWRDYTRLYAGQCRDKKDCRDAAMAFLSIGEVYAAVECLVKGQMWHEALSLIELRCAPSDPIHEETALLYATHLQKQEKWSAAGRQFRSLAKHDQAIACFLRDDDTLEDALNLMNFESHAVQTYVDLATRALLHDQFMIVEKVITALPKDSAEAFLLQVYLYYIDGEPQPHHTLSWSSPTTGLLWSHLQYPTVLADLPPLLKDKLNASMGAFKTLWSQLIPYIQAMGSVDAVEDALSGDLDTRFTTLMQAKPVHYRIVKSLCHMGVDLVQEYFIGAFETWSACVAFVAQSTDENESTLLHVLSLVFPCGVDTTFPHVGELASEAQCSADLWAMFFLHQCIGFSRMLRAATVGDDHEARQDTLLYLIQWINRLLPTPIMKERSEAVTRAAQTAMNDLSLLYHQLLDKEANDEEPVDVEATAAEATTTTTNDPTT